MEFKDYYQVLGIERGADAGQVKHAFRKLARKYHPDVSKEPDAEARMKDVNEAYGVLSDPQKRAAYDQVGESDAGFEVPGRDAGAGEDTDFGAFFDALFRGGPARPGRESGPFRGEDHHAKIEVGLEDSLEGSMQTLTLRSPRLGAGGRPEFGTRTLEVKVPRGVREGQHIRLVGQGGPGFNGGEAGDLFLEVRIRPHALYRVDGRDLYLTLPVAPWEAALGAAVEVPTPGGTVEVKVPPGSQTGRRLRLRGRGIPGEPPGDLYAVLEVALPPAETEQARNAYAAMARDLAFDPRQGLGATP